MNRQPLSGWTCWVLGALILFAGRGDSPSVAEEPATVVATDAETAAEPVEDAVADDAANPADGIPAALTHYQGREIAQTMHFAGATWLTRESRQREEDCTTMLKALRIERGQRVCDMGCGNGFYTLKLARLVGPKGGGGGGRYSARDAAPAGRTRQGRQGGKH